MQEQNRDAGRGARPNVRSAGTPSGTTSAPDERPWSVPAHPKSYPYVADRIGGVRRMA